MPALSGEYLQRLKKVFCCRDCGKRCGGYMVRPEVWQQIWPTYQADMAAILDPKLRHGILCIRCAQHRLGRKFRREDFSPTPPCNDVVFFCLDLSLNQVGT